MNETMGGVDGDIILNVDVMQNVKRKVCGVAEMNSPLNLLDQLVMIAAVCSREVDELRTNWASKRRERSKSRESGDSNSCSAAMRRLRKLNANKIICMRRDEEYHHDVALDRGFKKLKRNVDEDYKAYESKKRKKPMKTDFLNPKKQEFSDDHEEIMAFNKKTKTTFICKKEDSTDRSYEDDSKSRKNQENSKGKKNEGPIDRVLPENFKRQIEAMGGDADKAQLVFQKKLYPSDLEKQQNRLSMPQKQLLCKFLEDGEVELLEKDEEMKFSLIDPKCEVEEICLKRWSYTNCKSYVLRTQWGDIAKKNRLDPGDLIQVWSFRDSDNGLHLAIVKKDPPS